MSDRAEQIGYLQRLLDRMTGRAPAPAPRQPEFESLPPPIEPPRRAGGPGSRPPTTPRSTPPVRPHPTQPPSAGITWGGTGADVLADPLHFIGQTDPLEGTVLVAGEQVSVCTRCGAGYHLATMSFIRGATAGACVSCGTAGMFRTLTLVVGASATIAPPPAVEHKPGPPPRPAVAPHDAAGRPIVQLHQVRDHVGEEVAFEGRVLRVHLTGGGAYFLYFERAARVLDGFRAVIRPRDIFHWEIEGIVPADAYPDQWVRIAGRVVDDPRWQLEMVIQRPEAIQLIEGPTEATGWRGNDGQIPDVPVIAPAQPVTVKTEPLPRVRWLG